MGNSHSKAASAAASLDSLRLDQIVRSDALTELNTFRKHNAVLREVVDEPIEIRLVLDACIIQQELRYTLRNKRNHEARSALREILDSGTVVPFAPPKLIEEIEEHIKEIAIYARVTEDRVRQEWATLRGKIHFYEPETTHYGDGFIDPDDAPYRQACLELGARAVYTKDSHFKAMQVPVIMIDLDRVLQKHARASSVKLAVSVGSSFTLVISFNVLKEFLGLAARGIQKIPAAVKIGFLVAAAAALIHPRSRNKIIQAGKFIWNKLNNPKFRALLSSIIIQTAEAHQVAATTRKQIEASLPSARRRHAINYVREICAVEKGALPLSEIIRRMKEAGYVTRSQKFPSYLRRIMRSRSNFFESSCDCWTLRKTAT